MNIQQFNHHLLVCAGLVCLMFHPATSHGRLWEPPGRSTMWRRGFNTPHNYQDNELFCGGFQHQVSQGYKCGVCGDPYDGPWPNEAGGVYATGTITRMYVQGQEVTFSAEITANHLGFMEFKLCPINDPTIRTTQACYDAHPLQLADGSGTRYYIGTRKGKIDVNLRLPADVTCSFCVVQWRYHAGNSWGTDPDGTECIGCGEQEEFYGCSDVGILPTGSVIPTTASSASSNSGAGSGSSSGSSYSSATGSASVTGFVGQCHGVEGRPDLDSWCGQNCQMGNCPESLCACNEAAGWGSNTPAVGSGCQAVGAFQNDANMDQWCVSNCAMGNCPANMCACY